MSISSTRMARQNGLTMIGFVVLVAVIAFFMTILLKVGPTYQRFWTARTILHEVAGPDQDMRGGPHAIMRSIEKRLDINMMSYPTRDDFSVKKLDADLYSVTLDYEERVHLFFNVDAVTVFKDQVEVKTQ